MSNDIIVRHPREEDTPGMARVAVDAYRSAHRGQLPDKYLPPQTPERYAESERNWRRTLRQIADSTNPRECVYIAVEATGEVVGFGLGSPEAKDGSGDEGEINTLYILASHHRRGIGRRLVAAVARGLATKGFRSLRVGCLQVNTPARRFYEALGGQVIGGREFVEEDGTRFPEVIYGWADLALLFEGDSG